MFEQYSQFRKQALTIKALVLIQKIATLFCL